MTKLNIAIVSTLLILVLSIALWPERPNPLIGSWESVDLVYGKPEIRTFTEFGLLEQGAHIPAEYDIERTAITVITNRSTIKYFIVTEDIIKQRVPRQTWQFFTRVGSEVNKNNTLSKSEITRY